jgi:hypothetical protein
MKIVEVRFATEAPMLCVAYGGEVLENYTYCNQTVQIFDINLM